MSTRFLIVILSLILLGGALILVFESKDKGMGDYSSSSITIADPTDNVSLNQ